MSLSIRTFQTNTSDLQVDKILSCLSIAIDENTDLHYI